jgi:hypothetical protein
MLTAHDPLYRRHRFLPEVYFRFPLSLRMVEEMLAARGICVTYETVRQWGKKFGNAFAERIRQRARLAATDGMWMRSSSQSRANATGSGAPLIKTVSFSTSWSSAAEISARRNGS